MSAGFTMATRLFCQRYEHTDAAAIILLAPPLRHTAPPHDTPPPSDTARLPALRR